MAKSDVESVVAELVESELTCGIQLAFSTSAGETDLSGGVDGCGNVIENGSISAWYCVTKTLTTLGIVALLSDHPEVLDLRVSSLFECRDADDANLWELLCHSSGWWGHRSERLMGISADEAIARIAGGRVRRRRPYCGAYSEFAGFFLAASLVERMLGVSFEEVVSARVLRPAGLEGEVYFRAPLVTLDGQLRCSATVVAPGVSIPWLAELSETCTQRGTAASGAYGTARGVVGLLSLVERLVASDDPRLQAMGMQVTKTSYDPMFRRRCAFSLGHLYDLRSHDFPAVVGRRSIGQVGFGGTSTAIVDLDRRVCVAWRDFTVHEDAASIFEVRRRIIEFVFDERAEEQT